MLTDSELPGELTKEQLEEDPRQADETNVINNWKRDFYLVRLANKTVWDSGDHRLEFTGFWSYKDLHHPIFVIIDQLTNDFGVSLRYDYYGEILGRQNSSPSASIRHMARLKTIAF